ncbi:hypothetical protein F5Y03DRAFT_309023 [Xylaria venustula]|nr:hypothetical protein F5Y03DRAFT_309023 [Xylaria venustula]
MCEGGYSRFICWRFRSPTYLSRTRAPGDWIQGLLITTLFIIMFHLLVGRHQPWAPISDYDFKCFHLVVMLLFPLVRIVRWWGRDDGRDGWIDGGVEDDDLASWALSRVARGSRALAEEVP